MQNVLNRQVVALNVHAVLVSVKSAAPSGCQSSLVNRGES